MDNSKFQKISDFSKSQARNKIVFCREKIKEVFPVDLGYMLSESIFNLEPGKLPMQVTLEIDKILQNSIVEHDRFGNILAIANLGILFEPELKINFNHLLDNYSQNNVLFIKWEGEIDDENLYFLTKEHGIKIRIKNLSHITL